MSDQDMRRALRVLARHGVHLEERTRAGDDEDLLLPESEWRAIAGLAIRYVRAREERNRAKATRNARECESDEPMEHDRVGVISQGVAPCFVRRDAYTCPPCRQRDVDDKVYQAAARRMASAWAKLKRRVERATRREEVS